MFPSAMVEHEIGGFDCLSSVVLHLRQDTILESIVVVGVGGLYIFLQLRIGQFICLLIFAVLRCELLNGVVCEVYGWIFTGFDVELKR